jgi:hypothetical protein
MVGPLVVIDAGKCRHLDLTEFLGTARLVFVPMQPASTALHRRRASWDGCSPAAWGGRGDGDGAADKPWRA